MSEKKKTICFIHYGIGWKDGVNAVLTGLAKEIKEQNPDLRICFLGGEIERRILKGNTLYKTVPELIPRRRRGKLNKKDLKKESLVIAKKIAEETKNMDVVVIENPFLGTYHLPAMVGFSLYASQYKSKDTKVFFRVHDLYSDSPQYFKNLQRLISPSEIRDIVKGRGVDGFLVIDSIIRTNLVKVGVPRKKISYLPNGIDSSKFSRKLSKREKTSVVKNLEIPLEHKKKAKLLVYPVRVVPRKNIEEAIFLTYFIREITNNNYILVISGKIDENDRLSSGYYKKLKELINLADIPVVFVKKGFSFNRRLGPRGKIKEYSVSDLYQVSSSIVMTSLREGFGYPFLECWFAKKIIIGRRTPNVITSFERNGLNFKWLYRSFLIPEKVSSKDGPEKYFEKISSRFKWLYNIFLIPEKFFLKPRKAEHLERVIKAIKVFKDPKLKKETWELNKKIIARQARLLQNSKKQKQIIRNNFKAVKKIYEISKITKSFLSLVKLDEKDKSS